MENILSVFYLRQAMLDDINMLYDLKNDKTVRAYSINKNKHSFDRYKKWFLKVVEDKNVKFYLAFSKKDEFIGAVRFSKKGDYWEISISIKEGFRGKGLASMILPKAIKIANVKKSIAYILKNNIASKKLFAKLGFKCQSTQTINKISIEKYTRSENE